MRHFADRLLAAIERTVAPVCVGLDPVWEKLPEEIRAGVEGSTRGNPENRAAGLMAFCLDVIQCVAPLVPAVKINIAFFEPYHAPGLLAYREVVKAAHEAGLIVIGDVKRADIGNTSQQYAVAHLSARGEGHGFVQPDAITINPYFGTDGVLPFMETARDEGRGVYILAQTSNPSAGEVQGLELADGRTVREAVAELIGGWAGAEGMIGASGYSSVGAVVSPTDVNAARRLRVLMPMSLFLVPGFGAQGRTAEEVSACFNSDGRGAIVASSRGVIFAYQEPAHRSSHGDDWRACIAAACRAFIDDVRRHCPRIGAGGGVPASPLTMK